MNGRLQIETLSSLVLKDNPLGDPRRREIPVYLPPSCGKRRLPVIYYLPGFTGGGRSVVNYNPWKENLAERYDRLIAEGKAKECLLVVADAFTAYGGSQYLNSSATGRYEDFIVRELVPFIEDKFAAGGRAGARALLGKSSGGFGALTLGMRHPGVFGHIFAHSADMGFETCYGLDLPRLVNALDKYGGSALKFKQAFLASREKEGFDHAAINILAMAACYSPNPRSPLGFDLPCEPRTGELDSSVWRRWEALDPVKAASRHRAGLKKLSTLAFDCGRRDEAFLHLGARRLAAVLKKLAVPHVYEEHERGHFDMNGRYDRSLALLSRRLAV